MRKKWMVGLTAGLLSLGMAMTSLAAEWKQDETGWWYQNDDGSYLKDGWHWVDGRCYYFDGNGYCLINTSTPDGYTVDASGAWTVDGVVQTKQEDNGGEEVQVGSLTFVVPEGFSRIGSGDMAQMQIYGDEEANVAVGVAAEAIKDVEGYEGLLDVLGEYVLDMAMAEMGTVEEKTTCQFPTGTWYRYRYSDADLGAWDFPGRAYFYGRISGAELQIVLVGGDVSADDSDAVMANNIRPIAY